MKKILFSLVALMCSMSMNAQVMKVMKNGEEVATYKGAEYTVVFEDEQAYSTTGTAKATIGGSEVDVNWVQLWENGPKFAEYNVGASSATDPGTEKTFTEATTDPFIWGANWCTPSKEDMEELVKAASVTSSEKVACEYTQESGTWGFKFTGKETGYTANSVFFPAQDVDIDSDFGYAEYWSGTASGDKCQLMGLFYENGNCCSEWFNRRRDGFCLVRPVLKN